MSTSMPSPPVNRFLTDPLASVYLKTALPIIFMMSMNGLLSVVDALFLGHYVGADALAAVTLMFPVYMIVFALSTLVSSGMSSQLARHLGANNLPKAQAVFVGAHGLALLVGAALITLFYRDGHRLVYSLTAGLEPLAEMGLVYLQIIIVSSPLMFIIGVNSDALRSEGQVGIMAAISLLVTLANIGFNYLLIAIFEMGVAGSAYGTVLAHIVALAIIVIYRTYSKTNLRIAAFKVHKLTSSWGRILALGAPQSLNFVGGALLSVATLTALQIVNSPKHIDTVSSYGIITRIMTFSYLPLLGLSFATQTIAGNNFGAQHFNRSNHSLTIGVATALIYCITLQVTLLWFAPQIGAAFVKNPIVIAEVARILPVITAVYFIFGPMMVIAGYFQAIGDAKRAALLSLSKPFLFAIPLVFILALNIGEAGIWLAVPISEISLLILMIIVLVHSAKTQSLGWGVFHINKKDQT